MRGADPATHRLTVRTVSRGRTVLREDVVAVEEPLQLRIGFGPLRVRRQKTVSVTMRTPGHDSELAVGFLFAEQVIASGDDVVDIVPGASDESNVVRVELHPRVKIDEKKLSRPFVAASSCGVCGKAYVESLSLAGIPALSSSGPAMPASVVVGLPDALRAAQEVFESTGGVHAAGLFSAAGDLIVMREDIGRHNAVDKVIGSRVIDGATCRDAVLVVSGRIGFEVVQKALVAGIPIVVSVGAPSSLAVTIADEFGMTLVGFARGERFNVYAGACRIIVPSESLVPARRCRDVAM